MGKDCDVCEDDIITESKKQAKTNKIAAANSQLAENAIPNED